MRVTAVIPAGTASAATAVDSVILDSTGRRVHRGVVVGIKGTRCELDLAEPVTLRMGDALRLADGRVVEVVAEAEPLIEVRAADPVALARLAWHLGDRHVPVQVLGNRIRLRRDPALAALLETLGARLVAIEGPFDPEGGAYVAAAHDHGHDCGHGHDHGHAHGHAHDHAHHGHHGHGAKPRGT
jgi:urease accessory protein